jgi:16S rRNA processing protein RimM
MPTPSDGPTPVAGVGIAEDEVELGFVSGFFGVRGELRLHLHNRESEFFATARRVILVGPEGERMAAVMRARPGAGKRILGRIDGVDGRDEAQQWHQWRIVVPRAELPALGEDEFYLTDVEGMEVHVEGSFIGRVRRVHSTGPVEVLEVRVRGKEPLFVPCEAEFIRFDFEAGVVHVVPEGLT